MTDLRRVDDHVPPPVSEGGAVQRCLPSPPRGGDGWSARGTSPLDDVWTDLWRSILLPPAKDNNSAFSSTSFVGAPLGTPSGLQDHGGQEAVHRPWSANETVRLLDRVHQHFGLSSFPTEDVSACFANHFSPRWHEVARVKSLLPSVRRRPLALRPSSDGTPSAEAVAALPTVAKSATAAQLVCCAVVVEIAECYLTLSVLHRLLVSREEGPSGPAGVSSTMPPTVASVKGCRRHLEREVAPTLFASQHHQGMFPNAVLAEAFVRAWPHLVGPPSSSTPPPAVDCNAAYRATASASVRSVLGDVGLRLAPPSIPLDGSDFREGVHPVASDASGRSGVKSHPKSGPSPGMVLAGPSTVFRVMADVAPVHSPHHAGAAWRDAMSGVRFVRRRAAVPPTEGAHPPGNVPHADIRWNEAPALSLPERSVNAAVAPKRRRDENWEPPATAPRRSLTVNEMLPAASASLLASRTPSPPRGRFLATHRVDRSVSHDAVYSPARLLPTSLSEDANTNVLTGHTLWLDDDVAV